MTRSQSFDMHGLASFTLLTDDRRTADYFAAEYKFAQDQLADGIPIVELRWRESSLPRSPGTGYQFHVHKAAARWYYRIELSESGVLIDGVGNRAAVPMVHHMLLHPSLRWLSSFRKALMMHAACVARNDDSLLISGAGGAGKTTTSTALLSRGGPEWRLLGDDYVLIGPDGKSYSHRTRAHLYLDLLRRFPELSDRLTAEERARLRVNWALRRLSGDRIKVPVRVELDRMWPGRTPPKSAQPAALLLLRLSNDIQPRLEPMSSSAETVDELMNVNFYEARHFIKLAGGQGNWLDSWKARERDLIGNLVYRIPAYELHVPRGTVNVEPYVLGLLAKESIENGQTAEI